MIWFLRPHLEIMSCALENVIHLFFKKNPLSSIYVYYSMISFIVRQLQWIFINISILIQSQIHYSYQKMFSLIYLKTRNGKYITHKGNNAQEDVSHSRSITKNAVFLLLVITRNHRHHLRPASIFYASSALCSYHYLTGQANEKSNMFYCWSWKAISTSGAEQMFELR